MFRVRSKADRILLGLVTQNEQVHRSRDGGILGQMRVNKPGLTGLFLHRVIHPQQPDNRVNALPF